MDTSEKIENEKNAHPDITNTIRNKTQRTTSESWEEMYEINLLRFWRAAHASADTPDSVDDREEWEFFKAAMVRLGPLGSVADGDTVPTEEIPGNLADVSLIVSHRIDQGLPQNEVADFIRTSLAPTIERLEQRQEGTPERRTDIIVKVLGRLRGSAEVADLGCDLMRYLQTQRPEQRSVGYYNTVDDVASLVSEGREEYLLSGAFISHIALNGVRTLLVDRAIEFHGNTLGIVSNLAYRLATMLSASLGERREQPGERAAAVLRDLQAISGATTPRLEIDEAVGAEVVAALGVRTRQPVDFLTALEDMGSVGPAWQRTRLGQARLVALSGVAAASADRRANAVTSFFNAGVTLLAEDQARPNPSEGLRRGRLLVNTIGLRLALRAVDDLYSALTGFSGLNCAVNLVGAFVQYRPMPDATSAVNQEFLPLIQDLVNLTNWTAFQGWAVFPGLGGRINVSLARLAASGEVLKLEPTEQPSFERLAQNIERAIAAVRLTMGVSALTNDLLDSAQLIKHLFDPVLVPDEKESLEELVEGVIRSRENPDVALVERYADYASDERNAVGRGPFVTTQVMSSEEWDKLARQLVGSRITTIAPKLRNFAL